MFDVSLGNLQMFPVTQPGKGSTMYFAPDNNLTPKCITKLYMYVLLLFTFVCFDIELKEGLPLFIAMIANMFCPKCPVLLFSSH